MGVDCGQLQVGSKVGRRMWISWGCWRGSAAIFSRNLDMDCSKFIVRAECERLGVLARDRCHFFEEFRSGLLEVHCEG